MPERTIVKETLPEDRVRLKPLGGMSPGRYLSILYALILLVILFFILIYPGISNPGSRLRFRSEPLGAAVRVDGIYRGTTPCELFIPAGERRFELVLPGFSPVTFSRDIGGRVFGSLLFPRRVELDLVLVAPEPVAVFREAAREYARWSLAGEASSAWQVPLVLSEGAYRLGKAAGDDPLIRPALEAILRESLGFAATRTALRDLGRAKFLLDNAGLAPSPLSLLQSAGDILAILGENPGSALWLAELLGENAAGTVLRESAWYAGAVETAREIAAESPAPGSFGGQLELGGLSFRQLSGGRLLAGNTYPRIELLGDFWVSRTEVTQAAWAIFLADNPEWSAPYAAALAAAGKATKDYLAGEPAEPQRSGTRGLPGLSWYAAEAYCRWLTGLLPASLSAWEVRLPTEAQWEYAARADAGTGILEKILGGLWEWCGDSYTPLDLFAGSGAASPEKVLRGGSWVNQNPGTGLRGSLPPEYCSPFVSFRPVIVPAAGGRP
ncbi:MAG: SUMF1/EgtB/PvdO family nonheme iron enzyme [Treponema sp.]|jgi:hypothetical protein|nr:SUMF1/EgtB/PvdO family nonheme iron enzyme [Treponema sp.]